MLKKAALFFSCLGQAILIASTATAQADIDAEIAAATDYPPFDIQTEDQFLPVQPPERWDLSIRAIVLRGTGDLKIDSRKAIEEGVEFKGVEPPQEEALRKQLFEYLGQKLNSEDIRFIKADIIQHYQRNSRTAVAVQVPEQDVSDGVLQFIVFESRIGKIEVKNNRWFSSKSLLRQLQTKPGDLIDESRLLNGIEWINQNPFRTADLIFAPGKGDVDLDLVVQDRFPFRVFVGGDNTGNDFTGNGRFYAGLNWGNAFWVGDLFTFQWTVSNEWQRFMSYYGNYTSYLPWKHILVVYGAYGTIEPNISEFRSKGHAYQGSFRYRIPFKPLYTSFQHELTFGADFKNTNSDLFFVGHVTDIPVTTQSANLGQLVLEYDLQKKTGRHDLTLSLQAFGSPAVWLPNQSDADYNDLRPGAKNRYFYGVATFGDIISLPCRFELSFLLRGQMATNPLLPSEMFALGGFDTVRGYDERIFLADDAFCFNFELRFPSLSLMKKKRDELVFLGFFDYGFGHDLHSFDGSKKTQNLLGAGPGMRYRIVPYLSARIDWGFQIHNIQFENRKFGKLHVGLTASY